MDKSKKSVLLGIMGTKFLDGFTENSQEYKNILITDTVAQSALKKHIFGRFMAILFLRNAEQSHFGEMLLEYRMLEEPPDSLNSNGILRVRQSIYL